MHLKVASRAAAILAVMATSVTMMGGAAQAAPQPAASPAVEASAAGGTLETTVLSYDARTCKDIKAQLGKSASCEVEETVELGPVEPTFGAVEAASSTTAMSAQDVQSLSAAGAINCRNWNMQRRPRDGSMLWQISQRGRHCWDGTSAWYGTYRGVAGFHECGYDDYGIFRVRSSSCTRSGNVSTQLRNSYSVTFEIPRTTIYSTFTLAYTGGRTGTYSTSGL